MKILHYVDENNLAWGETWTQLLLALAARGVDNFVACRDFGTLTERLTKAGISFGLCRPLAQTLPFTNIGLGRFIDSFKPELIHTRLSSAARIGGWWGRRKNVPVLQTIDKYPKLKYHRDGDFFAACSSSVRDYFISLGVADEKITVLHNPIDVSKYLRDDEIRRKKRAEHSLSDDAKVILAAGRFVAGKGFDVLIKGFEIFLSSCDAPEKYLLWIVGDGEEKHSVVSIAAASPFADRIKIFPFASDVRPYMWAADLFVLPSNGPEAFGVVLLEAMACGLPSIATKACGPLDIVEDGVSGWFAEVDSAESIAEQLRRALSDDAALLQTGMNAAKRAEEFNVEKIADETIRLYQKIIKGYHS